MPTYAYRCVICSHEFARLEKMSAPTRTKCPECGERAERLITGGAITDRSRIDESVPSC